jgi:hypothetical protein
MLKETCTTRRQAALVGTSRPAGLKMRGGWHAMARRLLFFKCPHFLEV